MSTNEKQFGIRLKEPALSIIEKRAEKINNSTPEVKITAGGVARYAVEEYAKKLDRKVVENQLQFPYIDYHTFYYQTKEDLLQEHPYITEDDFRIEYSPDELKKLANAFEEIAKVLRSNKLIPNEQVVKWESVANELHSHFNNIPTEVKEAQKDADIRKNILSIIDEYKQE